MDRIFNSCNANINKNNYLKDKTVCKSCCKKKHKKKNNSTIIKNAICTSPQQPKNDKINNKNFNSASVSAYEYLSRIIVGPRNVGKIYYMVKY